MGDGVSNAVAIWTGETCREVRAPAVSTVGNSLLTRVCGSCRYLEVSWPSVGLGLDVSASLAI
jgi:hypothetical protein